jgi:hypothetical protein
MTEEQADNLAARLCLDLFYKNLLVDEQYVATRAIIKERLQNGWVFKGIEERRDDGTIVGE